MNWTGFFIAACGAFWAGWVSTHWSIVVAILLIAVGSMICGKDSDEARQ